MKLIISRTTYKIDKDKLERVAQAAFSYLKSGIDGFIELKFVNIAEIKALNLKYRNLDKPTDVLSFEISDKPVEGQVVICYNFVVESAKTLRKALDDELSLLVAHGILHIYGYDHGSKAEESEMQRIENEILKQGGK